MTIRTLAPAEIPAAIALWEIAGLTRPWNDPAADARLALETPTSTILAAFEGERIVATVMTGFDGHRAWVYYLATIEDRRGQGFGRAMMAAAEAWCRERGAPKLQLMVRETNDAAIGFYEAIGYGREPVAVFSRWLNGQTRP